MKGKAKMDLIADANERRTTYRKRKGTLLKKLDEVTTLCGVEAGMIMFSEFELDGGPQTWPVNAEQFQNVMNRCKTVIGTSNQKDAEDTDSLLERRLAKEKERLRKLEMDNAEKGARQLMVECLKGKSVASFSLDELKLLSLKIDEDLKSVGERKSELREGVKTNPVEDQGAPANPCPYVDPVVNLGSVDGTKGGIGPQGQAGSTSVKDRRAGTRGRDN